MENSACCPSSLIACRCHRGTRSQLGTSKHVLSICNANRFKACKEHEKLGKVLDVDVKPVDYQSGNVREQSLAALLRRAIDIDPVRAPKMVETLQQYLATFDSRNDDFDSMAEYMPYRIANCGYW